MGALDRFKRTAPCTASGLVPARGDVRHRAAGAVFGSVEVLRVERFGKSSHKKPGRPGFLLWGRHCEARR